MSVKSGSNFTYRAAFFLLLILVIGIAQASEPERNPILDDMLAVSPTQQTTAPNSTRLLVTGKDKLFHIPLIGRITDVGFRVASVNGGQFDGLSQRSLFVDFELPWQWSPWQDTTVTPRIMLEVGRFDRHLEHRSFASLGPVFRFERNSWRLPMFLDLGISPTAIDRANSGDSDYGTSLNFTSHVAFGFRFGRNSNNRISLRYQHISNVGINSKNPGVNMAGIDFVFWSR